MALIGRGMGLIHSSRRVRKSKERHSVRKRPRAHFQVEQLETRTLLATGPFPEPSQLLPLCALRQMPPSPLRLPSGPPTTTSLRFSHSLIKPTQPIRARCISRHLASDWSGNLIVFGPSVPVSPSTQTPAFEGSTFVAFPSVEAPLYAARDQSASAPAGWVGVGIVGGLWRQFVCRAIVAVRRLRIRTWVDRNRNEQHPFPGKLRRRKPWFHFPIRATTGSLKKCSFRVDRFWRSRSSR